MHTAIASALPRLAAADRMLEAMATQGALSGLIERRGSDIGREAEGRRTLRENAHLASP